MPRAVTAQGLTRWLPVMILYEQDIIRFYRLCRSCNTCVILANWNACNVYRDQLDAPENYKVVSIQYFRFSTHEWLIPKLHISNTSLTSEQFQPPMIKLSITDWFSMYSFNSFLSCPSILQKHCHDWNNAVPISQRVPPSRQDAFPSHHHVFSFLLLPVRIWSGRDGKHYFDSILPQRSPNRG